MDNKQQNDNNNNNFFNKNPLLIFAIFSIVVIVIFKGIFGDSESMSSDYSNKHQVAKNITYSEFKELVKQGQISEVGIGQNVIKAKSESGSVVTIYNVKKVHGDTNLIKLLEEKKVPYGSLTENTWLSEFIFSWLLPILVFFGIWLFLANRMQKNMGSGVLGIGKNNKLINSEKPQVKFDDVAGAEEAKEEVKEIVDFLKHPDRYIDLGAKIPKGVLLVGPPGTGKTLLAKAVAGEADVPFLSVSGSSFIEMFVGVGASRVRDLFETAKKDAPAIVFIDEIDAIGKSRAAGGAMGGNDEREQTLNQLLAEMDGFSSNMPIIVLAATNRPEVLDAALLRPGRFDRQVVVDKPDFKGRIEILKVHIKDIKPSKDVDIEEVARMTAGLAGADLANIINEAALLAGRANKKSVEQQDFIEAIERAIAGLEKKNRRINPKEKKIVAYHESGHALLSETTKGADRVNKVTIVPRGFTGGYVLHTPEENRFLKQKYELMAEVDVLLAGRAAEDVFIGEISTGASNDLERSTDILKAMVGLYGMSEVAGLMVLEKQRNLFLNGGTSKDYSDKMAEEADAYIKNLLNERYSAVKERLETYRGAIEELVKNLYEVETIEGAKVREIIANFEKENNLESRLVKREDLSKDTKKAQENKIKEDEIKDEPHND